MASNADTDTTSESYFSYPSEKETESSYRGTSTSLDTSADSKEDGIIPSIRVFRVVKRLHTEAKQMSNKPYSDSCVEEITKGGVKFYPEGVEDEVNSYYKDIIQQIKDLTLENAVVYISACLLVTLNADQEDIKMPKDLYCDICILSSKYPPIIVNVSHKSPRDDNRAKYLAPLARYINKELRTKAKDDITCLVCEIGLGDKISEAMIFTKLEEVHVYSTPESLKMTKAKYQSVVKGFLNMICTCKTSKFIDYEHGNVDLHQLTHEEFDVLTQALDIQIGNTETIIETSCDTLLFKTEIASRLSRKEETLLELPQQQFRHLHAVFLRKDYPKLILPHADLIARQHSHCLKYIVTGTEADDGGGSVNLEKSTEMSLQEINISQDEIIQDGHEVVPDDTTADRQHNTSASTSLKEITAEYTLAHATYVHSILSWDFEHRRNHHQLLRPLLSLQHPQARNTLRSEGPTPCYPELDKVCSSRVQPDNSPESKKRTNAAREPSQKDMFSTYQFSEHKGNGCQKAFNTTQIQENVKKTASVGRPHSFHTLLEPASMQSSRDVRHRQDLHKQSHRQQTSAKKTVGREASAIQYEGAVVKRFSKVITPRPNSFHDAMSSRNLHRSFIDTNPALRKASSFPKTDADKEAASESCDVYKLTSKEKYFWKNKSTGLTSQNKPVAGVHKPEHMVMARDYDDPKNLHQQSHTSTQSSTDSSVRSSPSATNQKHSSEYWDQESTNTGYKSKNTGELQSRFIKDDTSQKYHTRPHSFHTSTSDFLPVERVDRQYGKPLHVSRDTTQIAKDIRSGTTRQGSSLYVEDRQTMKNTLSSTNENSKYFPGFLTGSKTERTLEHSWDRKNPDDHQCEPVLKNQTDLSCFNITKRPHSFHEFQESKFTQQYSDFINQNQERQMSQGAMKKNFNHAQGHVREDISPEDNSRHHQGYRVSDIYYGNRRNSSEPALSVRTGSKENDRRDALSKSVSDISTEPGVHNRVPDPPPRKSSILIMANKRNSWKE